MSDYKKLDIDYLIDELPIADKIRLLSGKDFWHFADVQEYSIPSVSVSDGPNGIRGQRFFNGCAASCFPCATGMAASFDTDLLFRIGEALAEECKAKGAHVLLGPTVNMLRSPLGGRGFESFSEDPLLSGLCAAAYINGVQSKGVAACIKHFVCNDQEYQRFSTSSVVEMRALREIYLEPFRLAIKHSNPRTLMTAYNGVNGVAASENKLLLDDILRKEWKWDGMIMSDWTGTYSTSKAILAGLDIEMPGPSLMRGVCVKRHLGGGKLAVSDIDARVRKILELINYAIASRIPFEMEEKSIDTPATRALLRESACSALVLLKNNASILPLVSTKGKTIAVIGSNAKIPVIGGGGSASLATTYTVSPLEGITTASKEFGATVKFEMGVASFRYLPLLDANIVEATIEFFIENPTSGDWLTDVSSPVAISDFSCSTKSTLAFMLDGIPYEKLGASPLCRFNTTFTPDTSGIWDFSLVTIGSSNLYIDGQLIVENSKSYASGEMFFGSGSLERRGTMTLESGKSYSVEVRHCKNALGSSVGPFPSLAGIRIGAFPRIDPAISRAAAVKLAKVSDVVVVVVGTNPDWESEGFDRKTIALPGESDALVEAILKVNPNAIIVTQSGTPVSMPWIDLPSTVIQAFFGGNELGNALADVLFGKFSPSGKLPITFPVRVEDNPAYHSFGINSPTPGKVVYGEGLFIGYRHYEKASLLPLFPFGHGLSYTTFEFSNLEVSSISAGGTFSISLNITNTGSIKGSEVAQVYISPSLINHISSPIKQLKAYKKIQLKPGQSERITIDLDKEAFSHYNEMN